MLSTHGVAGLIGGLLTGILANPDMIEYIGTDKDAPGRERNRLVLRQLRHQFMLQVYAAAFIIVFNVVATFVILKVISIFVVLADGRGDVARRRRRGPWRDGLQFR